MQYCNRCVMPDTKPGITIDEEGVCSACRSNELKRKIDWAGRREELRKICDAVRGSNGKGYDCIVPVSGGKDSTYQVWMMKEIYRMNVLCVCLGTHLPTQEGIENLNAMVTNLRVDLLKIHLKQSVYRKIRRKCFVEIGEPNWAEHCAMFASVTKIALLYRIPLIVWGEDIAVEFGGRTSNVQTPSAEEVMKNDLIKSRRIQDWLDETMTERNVFFYHYPSQEELKKCGIRSIYLGYYDFWDGRAHLGLAEKYGFKPRREGPLSGNVIDYDNIDEKLCEINIWMKYIKFGFWRPTDQCCYQIWNGRMTREEAVKLVNEKQDEFPVEYFKDFLDYHQLTQDEFWSVVERFRNHDIWEKVNGRWRLKVPLTQIPASSQTQLELVK